MPKIFPKDDWEKTSIAPQKVRGIVELFRPFTLLAPIFGGIFVGLMALAFNGNLAAPTFDNKYPFIEWPFDVLKLIYGSITLAMINAGSNSLNQVYDLKIDRINKPYRPIPSKKVTCDEARTVAYMLYSIAIFRATLINGMFGFLLLVLALITVLYSVPPVQLKKRLMLNNLTIALARGTLGIVTPWCIYGNIYDPQPWIIGGVMGLFLFGATTTKDYTDIKGDKKYGMRTFPVIYGVKKSVMISAPFLLIPFLIIPLLSLDFLGDHRLPMETRWLGLLFFYGLIIVFLMLKVSKTQDKRFENSPVWKHMYLLLMCLQIGFSITFIMGYK